MADALARDALSAVFSHLPLTSLYVARKVCKEWRTPASEEVQRRGLTDANVFADWCAGAPLPAKIRAAANLRMHDVVHLRASYDFMNTALLPVGWSKCRIKNYSMRYA